MQRGFVQLIILGLVVFIFIVAVAWYAKVIQIPNLFTTDWKTYTNSEFGYSVKYPPIFTPNELPNNDTYLSLTSFNATDKNGFSIQVRNSTLEEEVKYQKWTIEGHVPAKLTREEKTTVNNLSAIRLEYTPEQSGTGTRTLFVIVNNDKYSYVISGDLQTVNQILPTFKLLGQRQNKEITTWKTYISKMGGYEVQYPGNWVMSEPSKSWIDIQNQKDSFAAEAIFASVNTGIISIQIVDMEAWLQQMGAKMSSEEDLFNPKSDFWLKLNSEKDIIYLASMPTIVGGKKAMTQIHYPRDLTIRGYPRQVVTTYYAWLGNSGNRIIRITSEYVETNPNKDALLKTFNQIISSFKFLDQNEPSEAANWKTYTNSTFSYAIKFPDQFEVPVQTSREVSQLGKDTNMCITKKTDGVCTIVLKAIANPQRVYLLDYVKSDPTLSADIWVEPTSVNGYDTLINSKKTHYLVTQESSPNVIEISATTWGKEELQILSSFRFLK